MFSLKPIIYRKTIIPINIFNPLSLQSYIQKPYLNNLITNTLILNKLPVLLLENKEDFTINYNLDISKDTKIFNGNTEITNDISKELTKQVNNLYTEIIKCICDKKEDLNNIVKQFESLKYEINGNKTVLFNKDFIEENYKKLINNDFKKLCIGIKNLNNLNNLNWNININKKQLVGGYCFKVDLFKLKKYDFKCNCYSCKKYDEMVFNLIESIKINDLNGIINNLIPSFVSKNDFHLLYEKSKEYLKENNLKFFN